VPLVAVALVIVAGLLHASWNFVAKKAGGDLRFAAFSSVFMVAVWAPLGVSLAVREVPQWGPGPWLCVLGSAMCHVPYFLLLLRGYRVADLTVVYPVARGSGPLITAAVAITVFGEAAGDDPLQAVEYGIYFASHATFAAGLARGAGHSS
jgi:multidrug transporter EmrE-like cation transporter